MSPERSEPVSALGVAYAHSVAFSGIDVKPVDVQVQISAGLPSFTIVGLPDKAVGESRERVRSALGALGIGLPTKRITVNLAPADLLKEGSHFDLPIALAILVAVGAIPADSARGYLALGELALDGAIRAVSGVLPAALAAAGHGLGLICPLPLDRHGVIGSRPLPSADGGCGAWPEAAGRERLGRKVVIALDDLRVIALRQHNISPDCFHGFSPCLPRQARRSAARSGLSRSPRGTATNSTNSNIP
jgi:hypothetical protein